MLENKDDIKQDRSKIEELLISHGAKNTENKKFLCPFHPDKNPSAEIKELPSGFYFICYACGHHMDYFALKSFVENIPLKESFDGEKKTWTPPINSEKITSLESLLAAYAIKHPDHAITEVNEFTDPDTGECTFATVRLHLSNKKIVLPATVSEGGWVWKKPGGLLPLFNRKRVKEAENILVVEGEKCVRAFTQLNLDGWAATTSAGGNLAAATADWSPLKGKTVVIWRDYDDPGLKYEKDIIDILLDQDDDALLFRVNVKTLDLSEGGDIADLVEIVEDPIAVVETVLAGATQVRITEHFRERLLKIESGEYRHVVFPILPRVSELSQALLPGTITLVVGSPGSAKSWMLMEIGWRLHELGESCRLMFLEDGHADYQKRCVAQMVGHSEYTDIAHLATDMDWSWEKFSSVEDRLESFFRRVKTVDSDLIDQDQMLEWIEQQADRGVRVIIVDPVTAAKASKTPWINDQKFVLGVKAILERTGASLIASSHPRAGVKGLSSVDNVAGGLAWTRFCHTLLWIEDHEERESVVGTQQGSESVKYRKSIVLTKARNGSGNGRRVAIKMDNDTLRIEELGMVLSDAEVAKTASDF